MKITVKEVPYMKWLSIEGIKRVARFNSSNEELVLDLYNLSEDCTEKAVLNDCEDGYFNYIYSNDNEEVVKDLKDLIEDGAENGHYFYFTAESFKTPEDVVKYISYNTLEFFKTAERHKKDEPNFTVYNICTTPEGEEYIYSATCATKRVALKMFRFAWHCHHNAVLFDKDMDVIDTVTFK